MNNMNDKEHELYKKIILDHSRNPYHFIELKDIKDLNNKDLCTIKADNIDCGDNYSIYILIKDKKIENIFFYGEGCALSKAATSILCKNIDKTPVDIAQKVIISFLKDMEDKDRNIQFNIEKPQDFRCFDSFRTSLRKGCVVFVFKAVEKYLEKLGW